MESKESSRIIKIGIIMLGISAFMTIMYYYLDNRSKVESSLKMNEALGHPISDSLIITDNGSVNNELMNLAMEKIKRLELINQFMESSPIAQMSKQYQDSCNCFVPVYFNKSFSELFLKRNGINPDTYLYSSEYSNWPDSLASKYEEQDFKSLKSGVYEFETNFILGDSIKTGRFVKWSDYGKNIYMYYLTTQNK